jgi:hypothetical protein
METTRCFAIVSLVASFVAFAIMLFFLIGYLVKYWATQPDLQFFEFSLSNATGPSVVPVIIAFDTPILIVGIYMTVVDLLWFADCVRDQCRMTNLETDARLSLGNNSKQRLQEYVKERNEGALYSEWLVLFVQRIAVHPILGILLFYSLGERSVSFACGIAGTTITINVLLFMSDFSIDMFRLHLEKKESVKLDFAFEMFVFVFMFFFLFTFVVAIYFQLFAWLYESPLLEIQNTIVWIYTVEIILTCLSQLLDLLLLMWIPYMKKDGTVVIDVNDGNVWILRAKTKGFTLFSHAYLITMVIVFISYFNPETP